MTRTNVGSSTRRWRVWVLIALGLAAAAVVGCGDDDPPLIIDSVDKGSSDWDTMKWDDDDWA